MTKYICSWWTRTDKMTPFNEHGISSPIFKNIETGQEVAVRDLPVGALYVIKRPGGALPNDYPPVGACDGLAIACKMSDGTWYIDGRASNCTKKNDNDHRCWVRHGSVGEKVTVDKNGLTCAAGAGSVFMDSGRWHGFLRNGELAP